MQHRMTSPHYQPNMRNTPVSVNQFNQCLVQEIQQNHPMLPFNRLNNNFNHHPQLNQIQMQHHNNSNNSNNNNNNNGNHTMNGKNSQMMQQMKVNGNLNKEYDEYANLMSTVEYRHSVQGTQVEIEGRTRKQGPQRCGGPGIVKPIYNVN
ncbi:transcription factor mef2A-like [Bradysia coprophila]|uniref:transcription factor mef2A-like n=1 Tax=Bradysia coprophila TaxID=38358 RepID=UPI00187DBBC6|nr:transcription factor mef2A-like [Bradysia coprophila]